jgi:hypothetical protein
MDEALGLGAGEGPCSHMKPENWIELQRHPASPSQVVRRIRARVNRSGTRLRIVYCVEGDIELIQVPSRSESVIGFELWRHTCLEAFVAIEGSAAYHEFNFAPSTEWAVYAFSDYRLGSPLTDVGICLKNRVRSTANCLKFEAVIRLDRLSASHPLAALRLGLAAVVETSDGFGYWALHHPAGKPDFHKGESFVLRLEPPKPGRASRTEQRPV